MHLYTHTRETQRETETGVGVKKCNLEFRDLSGPATSAVRQAPLTQSIPRKPGSCLHTLQMPLPSSKAMWRLTCHFHLIDGSREMTYHIQTSFNPSF